MLTDEEVCQEWGCQNATTPNGDSGILNEILALIAQSGARHSRPQPAPHRQPAMLQSLPGHPAERSVRLT